MKTVLDKFRILNTIALVVFCLAIGHVTSLLLTCLIFDVNTSRVLEVLKDPINADRNLIILISLLYTLLSFFIIPNTYLLLYKKDAVSFLWKTSEIRFTPLVLSTITVF